MATFTKPTRAVHSVFLHCSASDQSAHDDVSVMRAWHLQRNWSDVGYHYFIQKSGTIQPGRDVEKTPSAQAGHNTGSLAICLHGLEESKFTESQFRSLQALCAEMDAAYGAGVLRFRGHREVSSKSCPVFNYVAVLGLDPQGHLGGVQTVQPAYATPPQSQGAGAIAARRVLEQTHRGADVRALQNMLTMVGYPVVADGVFGKKTYEAVRSFQQASGVGVDGAAGRRTLQALTKRVPSGLSKGQFGPRVAALQQLLFMHRIWTPQTGLFDRGTEEALVAFKTKARLPANTELDAPTLRALLELS